MDAVLDKSGRLNSNVQIGKFTVLVASVGTYNDGVDVPSGANVGPVVGVAQESRLPDGYNDYSGGQYQITSGTAWPANAIPSSITGKAIGYRMMGITKVVAASAISVGDRVNIADSQGRVKTIAETSGTLVYEVGWALDAAGQANDVIRIVMCIVQRKT